jgi:hypothetical protein
MYQSPTRVRTLFVAVIAGALLAACSGGGMNATPSTGSSAQGVSSNRTAKFNTAPPTATPTVAPTATPASNFHYKVVTGLKMDASGNFSELRSECSSEAPSFESDTAVSLPVADQTVLNVCTSDDDSWDGWRDESVSHFSPAFRTVSPPPTATPAPTPTPGVATNLVIIRKTVCDEDQDSSWGRHGDVRSAKDWGRGDDCSDGWGHYGGDSTVVLTGVANLYNNVWTFPALGITNDLAAGKHYKFYVAKQVADSDDDSDHRGGDNGNWNRH